MSDTTYGQGSGRPPEGSPSTPGGEANPATAREPALRGDLKEMKQFAEEQTEKARDAAEQMATDEKNFAARQLGGVATVLRKVGSELEQSEQKSLGRYTRNLGSSLESLAGDLKDRNLGDIAGIAEDFGRRKPAAFLSIAALAGFAASRFLTASAERRAKHPQPTTTPPSTSSNAGRIG
ncbi:hypothetical protein [Rhizobium sullae]|uniref:hypothetical protein n=1 Tax=Rhizobium sullae TaxID=50338 RepID=UPI000B35209C|nr:hypothetical protein [Rhizobium sullae]